MENSDSRVFPQSSFPDLGLAAVSVTHGKHLPRWETNGAIYHISLHLADSVPQAELRLWREERARLSALATEVKRPLTEDEIAAMRQLFNDHIEKYLAAGCGDCLLKNPHAADEVEKTIEHANGRLYALHEWCIMPNHLHVIVGGFRTERPMREILGVWKRVSSHAINRALGREGEVWHRDAYTRIIRDREEYVRQLGYVWHNPEESRLKDGYRRMRYVGEA